VTGELNQLLTSNEEFNTFYYTEALISDKRSLSLLSLMSDSVYFYYLSPFYFLKPLQERWETEKEKPFFKKSICEETLITSLYHKEYLKFTLTNKELIDTKILRPILVEATPPDWESLEQQEKIMMEKHAAGFPAYMWGQEVGLLPKDKFFIDCAHFVMYRWQSIAGALYFAIKTNITPISDNPILSSIACETVTQCSDISVRYNTKDLSKHLGFKVLSSLLPNFGSLNAEQILATRDELHDELMAFRYEILQVTHQSGGDINHNLEDIIKFKIKPRIENIKRKLSYSKKAFHRKITETILAAGTSATLLTQFISLPTYAKIATGVGIAGKMLLGYSEFRSSKEEILSSSENKGWVLLLKLENLNK
jgi:hypothetical protein